MGLRAFEVSRVHGFKEEGSKQDWNTEERSQNSNNRLPSQHCLCSIQCRGTNDNYESMNTMRGSIVNDRQLLTPTRCIVDTRPGLESLWPHTSVFAHGGGVRQYDGGNTPTSEAM
ncbi:hypothetical protein AAHC03_024354 [Spirometra sp. Aus1]